MATTQRTTRAASILVGAARVAAAVLWLHEAFVKFRAHFGSADILLIVTGAASNSRVPDYFRIFAQHLLRPAAAVAGILTPLTELVIGMALILGIFSLWAAVGSVILLATYWSSDQLITQDPIMLVLALTIIVGHAYARPWSVRDLLARARPITASRRRADDTP
ncbi:MAG: hypothetical protein HOQ24_10140 [Mycobacteriaceae bacterium]|nr:hypothetical protein [Mycobacteriaceae bacterium]